MLNLQLCYIIYCMVSLYVCFIVYHECVLFIAFVLPILEANVKVSVFIIQIGFSAVRIIIRSKIHVASYEVAVLLHHLLFGELVCICYCTAWL